MNIALLNSVILNGGDAGIVYGILGAIQNKIPGKTKVSVFAREAFSAAPYYPDLNIFPMPQDTWPRQKYVNYGFRRSFPLRSTFNLLTPGEKGFYDQLRSMDAIVYCGGGYINNLYTTEVLFRIINDTLSMGIPHMAYAHSLGPFYDRQSQAVAARLLSRFDAITTRDKASYELLSEMGVTCKEIHFTADAAFAMQVSSEATLSYNDRGELKRIQAFKYRDGGAPLLFVSVRDWSFPGNSESSLLKAKYRFELQSFIATVIAETNYRICFISTCQGREGYGIDDSRFAAELLKDLPPIAVDRVYICNHPFMPASYPFLITQCADLVISMRMHFIIFSIMAGVPFIAIAYEKKSRELAKQVGVDCFCHDLPELRADRLYKSFVNIQNNSGEVRATVESSYKVLRERSLENTGVLMGVLRN